MDTNKGHALPGDGEDLAGSPVRRAAFHGVRFVGGYQFWPNAELQQEEGAVAIILARPTLLDMVFIVYRYGAVRVADKNEELLLGGAITSKRHELNARRIDVIQRGLNAKT